MSDDIDKRLDAAIAEYCERLDKAREENARLRRELALLQEAVMSPDQRQGWVRTFAAAALARDDATPSMARADALELWDELEQAFTAEREARAEGSKGG